MLVQPTSATATPAFPDWASKPSNVVPLPKQPNDVRKRLAENPQSLDVGATMTAQLDDRTQVYKPTRLNFARLCRYCDDIDCTSPRCIDLHDRSMWAACSDCDGGRLTTLCEWCLDGIVEVNIDTVPDTELSYDSQTGRYFDAPMFVDGKEQDESEDLTPVQPVMAKLVPDAPGALAYSADWAEYVAYKQAQHNEDSDIPEPTGLISADCYITS